MTKLIQLIYASAATQNFSAYDLVELLGQSRAKNSRLKLTGMLLYAENSFFQVLEGEAEEVDDLFQTISKDRRHTKVITIIREPIAKRSFSEWTMGFASVNATDLQEIIGVNDFFSGGSSFTDLSPGRAKKLLTAFKQGRWRSKLNAPVLELVMQ